MVDKHRTQQILINLL
jgi:signal transduction histidine kinase